VSVQRFLAAIQALYLGTYGKYSANRPSILRVKIDSTRGKGLNLARTNFRSDGEQDLFLNIVTGAEVQHASKT
jgi:hypothetical protein